MTRVHVDGWEMTTSSAERHITGSVVEQLPSALYRVRLDEGPEVVVHVAAQAERNFIRVLVGDRVRIELSPVDVGRGRIVEKI